MTKEPLPMVEVFAVASGKGGTGKTTSTLALGMALAEEYDVTVIDTDTGLANLLFHAGLEDVDVTLHDLLIEEREMTVEDATYDRFGMQVVPCGTSLSDFQAADPERLRDVVAELALGADVILLDSPATIGSKEAVLPIVIADRTIVVLQPTIPSISDGLKVQEYARSYGTETAGVLFNKVRDRQRVDAVSQQIDRYFDGRTLSIVPDSDRARAARRASRPLLAHAPASPAAESFRQAARRLDVRPRQKGQIIDRFRSAVIPDGL